MQRRCRRCWQRCRSKVLTYSIGHAGSDAGALAMSQYLSAPTLDDELNTVARYYAGEITLHLSPLEQLAQDIHDNKISFLDALDELMADEIAQAPDGFDEAHVLAIEERLTLGLTAALTRLDFAETNEEAPTVAVLRPDMSPALATKLGIDRSLPLTTTGVANLLNVKRVAGDDIDGKRLNKPQRTLVEIFGLDPKEPPTGQALEHVLAGRRVDGTATVDRNGKEMTPEALKGPQRRFLTALGVRAGTEPTDEQMANIRAGKAAGGFDVPKPDYQRVIHATKAPLGFADLTYSADKTLSAAFALGSEAERAIILGVHQNAVADAMKFFEQNVGWITKGAGGKDGEERAEMAWMSFQHYTARPAVDIAMTDAQGVSYTELHDVKTQKPDPQLHSHVTVLASLLGKETGRIGALDLDKLDGFIHQAGAVYQARVAYHATQAGIEVKQGKSGEARIAAIPDEVRNLFSKRTLEAEDAARTLAKEKGLDWDTLDGPQRIGLLKAGAGVTRNEKAVPGRGDEVGSDFEGWRKQAEAIGYQHESVLRPDMANQPMLWPEQRQALAYELSQKMVGEQFIKTNTLDENQLRVLATRAFIGIGGIGSDPAADIEGVMQLYRQHGIEQQDGQKTSLEWGNDVPIRGRDRVTVTTSLHADQERELVSLMTAAANDKSAALKPEQIAKAAEDFLARNPKIDRNHPQWEVQREFVDRIGTGGKFGVAIGASGAGKSKSLEVLNDAWKADGRDVYGAPVAHRQATDLRAAGIDECTALDAFLARVERGKYILSDKSVVVVDEVSQLSTKQQLSLLRLQSKHGFALAEVGDFSQLQSVDASAGVKLIEKVLPDMPQILTSIRQRLESERELTKVWRDGDAAEGLARKKADGTALMVAGGRARTVERVAKLWHERTLANPDGTVTISTVSNAEVRELGEAIRSVRRQAGELGADIIKLKATDRNETFDLSLAVGDRIRVFDRVHDATTRGRDRVLANNGSIVEVLGADAKGLTVRNDEGMAGVIAWAKIRDKPDAPIRATLGYAMSTNLAQGITSTEHIHAPLDGSKTTNAYSAYVAMSRHTEKAWLVLNESAIRRQIAKKDVEGMRREITPDDVWRQAAQDFNRKPERGSSLEMLARVVDTKRGGIANFVRSLEPAERLAVQPKLTMSHAKRLGQRVVQNAIELPREIKRQVERHLPNHRPEQTQGPSMRL